MLPLALGHGRYLCVEPRFLVSQALIGVAEQYSTINGLQLQVTVLMICCFPKYGLESVNMILPMFWSLMHTLKEGPRKRSSILITISSPMRMISLWFKWMNLSTFSLILHQFAFHRTGLKWLDVMQL